MQSGEGSKDQQMSDLIVTLSPVLIQPLPRWRTNYPLRKPKTQTNVG
jgi:hypothetical protein